ncbi:MAG: ATP-binding protein [Phycisphaeraceae bacterium]
MGITGAAASAAALGYFAPPDIADTPALLSMGVALLLVGIVVGGVHAGAVAHRDGEMRRLMHYVESVTRGEGRQSKPPRGASLRRVAQAINQGVTLLRQRSEDLAGQKRELEVQLRISDAQRQHAEAILNSIHDSVIVTDAFNELALANESASRVLAFDLQRSSRQPIDEIIHDAALVKLIKDTREGGDASLRRHVEHRMGSNGEAAIYDVTLTCVVDHKQSPPEPSGVVTILRDITREREIAEMKSDFVSSVSHELRTPLSSIKAYLEMLIDGEATDEETRAEFYNIIQSETNRLARLIDNILNISRIESGVVKVQREHISLPTLLKEAIEVMQPQARAKNITLTEMPTPVFFQVFADKDMIYQATLNLISNAIKYTPNDGKVTVSVSVDEHAKMVNVSVVDTGVGVPTEALPHLFQKFFRVSDHKKMAKGTGLGLNLVKQIVENVHGGKVSVTSTVGKGSTFTYCLPMAENVY